MDKLAKLPEGRAGLGRQQRLPSDRRSLPASIKLGGMRIEHGGGNDRTIARAEATLNDGEGRLYSGHIFIRVIGKYEEDEETRWCEVRVVSHGAKKSAGEEEAYLEEIGVEFWDVLKFGQQLMPAPEPPVESKDPLATVTTNSVPVSNAGGVSGDMGRVLPKISRSMPARLSLSRDMSREGKNVEHGSDRRVIGRAGKAIKEGEERKFSGTIFIRVKGKYSEEKEFDWCDVELASHGASIRAGREKGYLEDIALEVWEVLKAGKQYMPKTEPESESKDALKVPNGSSEVLGNGLETNGQKKSTFFTLAILVLFLALVYHYLKNRNYSSVVK